MTESPTASAVTKARATRDRFSAEAAAAAKSRLIAEGKTYASWADEHGFNRRLVYEVLAGRRACVSGTSHRIAVALGLKGPASLPGRLEGVRP